MVSIPTPPPLSDDPTKPDVWGSWLVASIGALADAINQIQGTPPPDTPGGGQQSSDLTATTGDGTITATWTAALDATGYTVKIEPLDSTSGATGATTVTKTAAQLTHPFTGLTNGATYLVTLTIGPSGTTRSLTATPAAPSQNLLAGKLFTSTVADSTIETGHPISLITDGDPNTRWISQPSSPVDITGDLGAVHDIDRIVINIAGNTVKNYTVSLSTNGSTFVQVATGVTNNTEKQTITVDNFAPGSTTTAKGRWVRITGADRWNTSFGNSFWEVAAYGTIDSSFPVGTISGFNPVAAGDTQVNLSWTYAGSSLANYTLKRNGEVIATLSATSTSYTDATGLTAGGIYAYELVGNFNAGGTTNTVSKSATTTGGTVTTGGFGYMIFVNDGIRSGTQTIAEWDIDNAVAAGASWLRLDIPKGTYGQTDMNTRAFTRSATRAAFYKKVFAYAKSKGMKICLDMAQFVNNSAWSDAQFAEATANQIKAVAADLGPYTDLIQVFNEHDGGNFRDDGATGGNATYWGRMRDCITVLRTAWRGYSNAPMCTTTFGYPVNQARMDRWVAFWDVVAPSCDVIGIHAYPEKSQTTIDFLTACLNNLRNRYSKQVAVLEFGIPSVGSYGTAPNYPEVGVGNAAQIAGVMKAKPLCAAFYQLRDRGTDGTGEMSFGILKFDGSQKGYYGAVKTEALKWKGAPLA